MKRISLNLYYGCIIENESYFLSKDENLNDNMFLLYSGERDWKGLFEMLPVPKKNEIYLVNISSEFADRYDKFNLRHINKATSMEEWESSKTRRFYSLELKDEGFIIDSTIKPFYKKKYSKIEYDCSRTHGEFFDKDEYLANLCPVNKTVDNNGVYEPAEFIMTVKTKKIN